MNMLVNATPQQTMTSREIAELTGKDHKNVTVVIESLIADQILTAEVQRSTFDHRGNTYKCFLLNKRDSLVVVARLSPEFTAAVIDRWQELEGKQNQVSAIDLNDPAFLRSTLITYTEKVLSLQHQVSELTEKSDALDRIADTSGLFGVREAAKDLKIRQSDLVEILFQHSWAYRDAKSTLQPYARAIEAGLSPR